MEATDILSSEHRVIERVAAALDLAAGVLERGGTVRKGFFLDAVRFLRDFADGFHHAKEERVLFPALAQRGFPVDAGPVGVMLHEHDTAREWTNGLRRAAERLDAGDVAALPVVVEHARGYAELLARHIAKEDGVLFPLAERALSRADGEALVPSFHRVEREHAERAGDKADWLALARSLADEMGVDAAAVSSRAACLPCHAR